jgi:hypothetical protein
MELGIGLDSIGGGLGTLFDSCGGGIEILELLFDRLPLGLFEESMTRVINPVNESQISVM